MMPVRSKIWPRRDAPAQHADDGRALLYNRRHSDRAALELGRVESVLAGAFCTIFGQSPADRFADIFDQVTYVAEHMVKDHIFEDGNKRTSLVFALSVLRFAGAPVVLSDSPEPKDNQYYAWIQDLVSSRRTNSELAEELRCGFVAGTGDLSLV